MSNQSLNPITTWKTSLPSSGVLSLGTCITLGLLEGLEEQLKSYQYEDVSILSQSWVSSVTRHANLETSDIELINRVISDPGFNSTNFPEISGKTIRRLAWMSRVRPFTSVEEIATLMAHGHVIKAKTKEEAIQQFEEILSWNEEIPADIMGAVKALAKAASTQKLKGLKIINRLQTKAHRGSLYVEARVLIWDGFRWRYESHLRAESLLEAWIREVWGPQEHPVSFQILNTDPEGEPIPDVEIQRFLDAGVLVVKEKAGVQIVAPSVPMKDRKAIMMSLANGTNVAWEFIEANRKLLTPAARILLATFNTSIDATYIPSIVTSPIEPGSGHKLKAVVTDCCDHAGNSLGMDGGGWAPPFFNGPQNDHQLRAMFPQGRQSCLYAKGELFTKWDACLVDLGHGPEGLWLDKTRERVCRHLGLSDQEFRTAYWEAAKACPTGYPEFKVGDLSFRMCVVLDQNQIKGSGAKAVKSRIKAGELVQVEGYLGALRREGEPGKIGLCFEALQWMAFDPNSPEMDENDPVKNCINHYQTKLVERLAAEGLDGLAAKAAQEDEGIAMMLKTLATANQVQARTNPNAVPMEWHHVPTLRARIWSSLAAMMYKAGDGGGVTAPQVVYQQSLTVPAGACVYSTVRTGQEVATFRFPMSTPTALPVVQAVAPKAHPELWADPWGYVPATRMVLNPQDLGLRMQGDDDGDKGGATPDPLVVAAAKAVWEHRVVNVEVRKPNVGGEKYNEGLFDYTVPVVAQDTMTHTTGMELAARSRRGSVGLATRLQQKAHALLWTHDGERWIRDGLMAELCVLLAFVIQAEIDLEKKLPLALQNWCFDAGAFGPNGALAEDAEGVWRVKPEAIVDVPGGYDMRALSQMLDEHLINRGIYFEVETNDGRVKKKACSPLGWNQKGKALDLDSQNWDGQREFEGGGCVDSLLHWSFRNIERLWTEKLREQLQRPAPENVNFGELIPGVLTNLGHNIEARGPEWFTEINYNLSRARTGAEALRKSFQTGRGLDEETRQEYNSMALLLQQRQIESMNLQELADAWRLFNWKWETTLAEAQALQGEARNKALRSAEAQINQMSRLINFSTSPLAIAIGITPLEECRWMNSQKAEMVAACYDRSSRAKTFEALSKWIATHGHEHAKTVTPAGESLHVSECTTCLTAAKTALVWKFRDDSRSATAKIFTGLIMWLNATGEYNDGSKVSAYWVEKSREVRLRRERIDNGYVKDGVLIEDRGHGYIDHFVLDV